MKTINANTKNKLGVTALIAIMEPATESQSSRANKQPLRSRPRNKIKVLLDSGSNGDLYFLPKGKDKPFPYLTKQAPKSWCMSNGSFQTKGGGKLILKFFEYSASREYTIQPDIVEYDKNHMTEPGFDLILGCNTMKVLGIVLDFQTNEITIDEISLPMRDIKNIRTRAAADKAWTMNNSIYQKLSKQPQSMLEATTPQKHDLELNTMTNEYGSTTQLVENTKVLCKDSKMVIPTSILLHAVAWYHHYLHHPGNTYREETLCLSMYWKGLRKIVQSHGKKYHICQVNKCRQHKYGKLLANLPSPPLGKHCVLTS